MSEETPTSPETVRQSIRRRDSWMRGAFILLFAVIYGVAEFIFWVVVVLQFGFLLLTGAVNPQVGQFSASLCRFLYQVLQYLSFNSDERPYPFAVWPSTDDAETGSASSGGPAKKKRVTRRGTSGVNEGD